MEILSKTFREAIITARRLGFLYIWIDSICILQADKSDWERESKLMGRVYANSILNIAASDAGDGDGGCFYDRTYSVENWTVELKRKSGKVTGTLRCESNFADSPIREFDSTILQQRAWTFQERCLSPRILHLAAKRVGWECRTCYTFEGSSEERLDEYQLNLPSLVRVLLAPKKENDPAELWKSAICRYSRRELTFSREKLVALSAVSELFSRV